MEPMLDDFRHVLEQVRFHPAAIPLVSNITGRVAPAEVLGSTTYWLAHVMRPVRFLDSIGHLSSEGVRHFIEVGPDGVLTAMAQDCLEAEQGTPLLVAAGHRDRPEPVTAVTAAAELLARGADIDLSALFEGARPRRVDLPTYAFQRERYWLEEDATPADAAGLGLHATSHPLLAAVTSVAEGDVSLFTGRISTAGHPWLTDHTVADTVLLPGTAFVEMALRAGQDTGCDTVRELVIEAPLALPADGGLQVQVVVAGPDASGRRPVGIHARPEGDDRPWTRHAAGLLEAATAPAEADLTTWPLSGAERVEDGDFYETLAEHGYTYGPAFQGLRAVWRRGTEVFAEVALPPEHDTDAARFALHPALFDAALHAAALDGSGGLPFAWEGVRLHAVGATTLRVALTPVGDGAVRVEAADGTGEPVLSVTALTVRPVTDAPLDPRGTDSLYGVEWTEAPTTTDDTASRQRWAVLGADPWGLGLDDAASTTPDAVPALVVLPVRAAGGAEVVDDVHGTVLRTLAGIAGWLEDERWRDSRLVVVTGPELAGRSAAGLVRSALSEHPGRIILVEAEGPVTRAGLTEAVASGEPHVSLRENGVFAPRLARVGGVRGGVAGVGGVGLSGSVLVSGGT
ncbi:polyketide synthase dehydratase domain-containing protein, partial [Streptomyces sp. NPDC050560]|uniref:polyketide synthase dehydratase domain-containing protein n=1 Tax=Streptomyces sp. NPDC050560 TaxID=3365630 RepID=UPI0037883753